MLALRIDIDGRPYITAGAEDLAFITFSLFCGRRVPGRDEADDIHVHLGGMAGDGDHATREHLRWVAPTLAAGTSITLTLVETDEPDPPAERFGADPASQLRAMHRQRQDRYEMYLALKEEFEAQEAR